MTCPRCQSEMYQILPLSYFNPLTANMWELNNPPTFRCVSCGNYLDSIIIKNRTYQQVAP